MRTYIQRQSGHSFTTWIMYLIVAILLIQFLVKAVPYYVDDMRVNDALVLIANDPDVAILSTMAIQEKLDNSFKLDEINAIATAAITVKKIAGSQNKATSVTVDYDVTIPFVGNASIVLSFRNYLDTSKPDQCCDAL